MTVNLQKHSEKDKNVVTQSGSLISNNETNIIWVLDWHLACCWILGEQTKKSETAKSKKISF